MRSRYLALLSSILFGVVVLIGLAVNGRAAAEPSADILGGPTLPTTTRASEIGRAHV